MYIKKMDIEHKKVDIETKKVDMVKVNISLRMRCESTFLI